MNLGFSWHHTTENAHIYRRSRGGPARFGKAGWWCCDDPKAIELPKCPSSSLRVRKSAYDPGADGDRSLTPCFSHATNNTMCTSKWTLRLEETELRAKRNGAVTMISALSRKCRMWMKAGVAVPRLNSHIEHCQRESKVPQRFHMY